MGKQPGGESLEDKVAKWLKTIDLSRIPTSVCEDEKRNFEGEFLITEIVLLICKMEGWNPAELKISEIEKDKTGRIIAVSIGVHGAKSIIRFGRFAHYNLFYPCSTNQSKEIYPFVPTIVRSLNDEIAEDLERNPLVEVEEFEGHAKDETIAEYENGVWYDRR